MSLATEAVASSSKIQEEPVIATNTATSTITPNKPVTLSCPFTSDITEDSKQKLALKEFDEKIKKANSSIDKALITRSGYHQSLLRVSWNLIESEILHSPGKNYNSCSNVHIFYCSIIGIVFIFCCCTLPF